MHPGADGADVLVAGAGPAGSVAALVLARAGVRVRLVDRARFPRDKLCGDTINPGTLALLDGLGVGPAVRAAGLAVTGMIVTGGGARIEASYPGALHGIALTRRALDSLLVDAAVAAGAVFDDGVNVLGPAMAGEARVAGVRVRCGAGATTLRARVVIAADGRASRLAAACGVARFARSPRRWAFGTYCSGVRELTSRGEMHIGRLGYVGIAPLPGSIANVCVVREAARGAGAPIVNAERVVRDAIEADAALRDRFSRSEYLAGVTTLGPLAVDAGASGCPGLLAAGDAAGFVDPMTGDGLRFAVRGAELAAEFALRELASGAAAHEGLHAARQREFRGKWRLNRALRALVSSPGAVGAAARIARHWPAPVEHLVAVAGDTRLA